MLAWAQLIATIVVGVIAAMIAWQQYRTNHHKLRLDLFDKRMMVFNDVMGFINVICRDADVPKDSWMLIHQRTNERLFLFDKDVIEYVVKVKDKALRFKKIQIDLKKTKANSVERSRLTDEDAEILNWFGEQQQGECAKIFMKYFKFAQKG